MPNVVQDGEYVYPVKFLYQTDKKKNARSKVTFLPRRAVASMRQEEAVASS